MEARGGSQMLDAKGWATLEMYSLGPGVLLLQAELKELISKATVERTGHKKMATLETSFFFFLRLICRRSPSGHRRFQTRCLVSMCPHGDSLCSWLLANSIPGHKKENEPDTDFGGENGRAKRRPLVMEPSPGAFAARSRKIEEECPR